MEVASLLAGERWSDHPSCTHPVLAQLAREVNDYSSDEGRRALASMIPAVVGANSADPAVAPALVVACTEYALPFATGALRLELEWARGRAERRAARVAGRRDTVKHAHSWWGRLTAWRRCQSDSAYLVDALCAVDHSVCALRRDSAGADDRLRALLAICLRAVRGGEARSAAELLTAAPYGIQSPASGR
jgi:hypothetical protein